MTAAPVLGTRLTDDECRAVVEHGIPGPVIAVWGEDWDGNPTVRLARSGSVVCLRGTHGKKFDVHGPQAAVCHVCGELIVVQHAGELLGVQQRHLWDSHGVSASLLP